MLPPTKLALQLLLPSLSGAVGLTILSPTQPLVTRHQQRFRETQIPSGGLNPSPRLN